MTNVEVTPQMARWLKSYSESTQERYTTALSHFCKHFETTPEETREWPVELAEDRMVDWKNARVVDYAGATVRLDFSAVKQWFLFNRIRVMVQCKNVPATRKTLDYIPTREDVQRLLDAAKLHHKIAIGILAFSGLRPIDVVRMEFQNIKASFRKGDEVLTIVKQHKKSKEWYIGFMGTQATRYVRGYLKAREEQGETITDTSPVVRWERGPLESQSLRQAIQRIINRSVGNHPTGEPFRRFRPYCLRKYFRRAVNIIGYAEAEYLMGHRKGLEGLASSYGGLRDLDPQAIDALKKKYISILPELETEITDTTLKVQLEKKEKERLKLADEVAEIGKGLEELKQWAEMMRDREKEG